MRIYLLLIGFIIPSVYGQNTNYSAQLKENYKNATIAYDLGDLERATALFNTCTSLDSTCFEAYLGQGLIAYELDNFSGAMLYCKKARAIRPFNADINALEGKTHYQFGNYSNAELLLKRSISIGNKTDNTTLILALTLQKLGKYHDAIYYYNRLIASNPLTANYYLKRGILYSDMEQFTAALTDFEKVLELLPENTEACINLAKTCFKINTNEQALMYINLGLKNVNATKTVDLFLLKGNYYQLSENYDTAAIYYEKAYQLENFNTLVLTHQAVVLIDLEQYNLAIEKCNEVIAIDSTQMEAYFNRGIANEMTRNIEGACTDWQQAFLLGSKKAIHYLNGPVCNE